MERFRILYAQRRACVRPLRLASRPLSHTHPPQTPIASTPRTKSIRPTPAQRHTARMRFVAHHRPRDINAVNAATDAVSASIEGWLIALTVWFCDVVDALPHVAWRCPLVRAAYAAAKRRIAANLRRATSDLRRILFLRATNAFRPTAGRLPLHRFARGVRSGVRASKAHRRIVRIATAGIVTGVHQGSLRERIARLRRILENPAALIARVLKRLHAIWRAPHGAGLILVASCDACASLAAPATDSADTS